MPCRKWWHFLFWRMLEDWIPWGFADFQQRWYCKKCGDPNNPATHWLVPK